MTTHSSTDRMTSEHTPGPWRSGYSNAGYVIFNAEGWTVANLPAATNQGMAPRRDADAKLIAAAPDLLALAKQYASECSGCDGAGLADSFEDNDPDDLTKGVHAVRIDCQDCADIRAVIAKAEGR